MKFLDFYDISHFVIEGSNEIDEFIDRDDRDLDQISRYGNIKEKEKSE